MNYMTGPALVELERAHLLRLSAWALASILAGATALLAARRRQDAAGLFWRHFGIQSAAWGVVDLLIAAAAWPSIAVRDLAGAIALDRFLWLNIGLDVGYAMVGVTLAVVGLRRPRRLGLLGAGFAIVLQAVALVWLDARLSATIVR